jgi:tripartite-type tricarboxylate transporter receptor subunit TctC
LEEAFLKIANDPQIKEQMKKDGFVPLALGAEASKAYIMTMKKRWEPVVKKFKK